MKIEVRCDRPLIPFEVQMSTNPTKAPDFQTFMDRGNTCITTNYSAK